MEEKGGGRDVRNKNKMRNAKEKRTEEKEKKR